VCEYLNEEWAARLQAALGLDAEDLKVPGSC
jgi:hypothetical protein